MPRKQTITKKVKRLTPREINYIMSAVSFYDEEHGGEYSNPHKYEDIFFNLKGRYKHLAIIVEEK
jgi:hypothetical protein